MSCPLATKYALEIAYAEGRTSIDHRDLGRFHEEHAKTKPFTQVWHADGTREPMQTISTIVRKGPRRIRNDKKTKTINS